MPVGLMIGHTCFLLPIQSQVLLWFGSQAIWPLLPLVPTSLPS